MKNKMKGLLIGLVITSVVFVLFTLIFYFSYFNDGVSSDPIDWQTFGSFFGGVLSPLLTFLSFIGVIIALFFQKESSDENEKAVLFNNNFLVVDTVSRKIDDVIKNYEIEQKGKEPAVISFPDISQDIITLYNYLNELEKLNFTSNLIMLYKKKYIKYIVSPIFKDKIDAEIKKYFKSNKT